MTETSTHIPRMKRLERSRSHKMLAGVAGGLGEYFDLNPVIFRLGLVVLTLIGGAGILVYLAAVLVMPAADKDASLAEEVLAQRREHPGRLIGLGLVAAAIFVLLSQAHTWPSTGAGWTLVLVAGLVILWTNRAERKRKLFIGIVSALAVLTAATITSILVAFAWFDVSLNDGVGDHTYHPASAAQVQRSYSLGIGNLVIDLSKVQAADVDVNAQLGIGRLRVIVPADASIDAHTVVKAGDSNDPSLAGTGPTTVHLNLHLGAGHIQIDRAA